MEQAFGSSEPCYTSFRFGNGKREPPYLKDFVDRIEKMMQKEQENLSHNLEQTEERDSETKMSFWMIANHPFFVRPLKIKGLFDAFYSSYKSIPKAERDEKVSERNKNTCENWHVERVQKNTFLMMVYWSQRETLPADYLTRNSEFRQGDDDYNIFPFTPADDYLALFIRTCFVHGVETVQVSLDLPHSLF